MIQVTARDFCDLAADWTIKHGICPRCGCSSVRFYASDLSSALLCDQCFVDEDTEVFENYDNWAIVVAVRALCATDIKIHCKECL